MHCSVCAGCAAAGSASQHHLRGMGRGQIPPPANTVFSGTPTHSLFDNQQINISSALLAVSASRCLTRVRLCGTQDFASKSYTRTAALGCSRRCLSRRCMGPSPPSPCSPSACGCINMPSPPEQQQQQRATGGRLVVHAVFALPPRHKQCGMQSARPGRAGKQARAWHQHPPSIHQWLYSCTPSAPASLSLPCNAAARPLSVPAPDAARPSRKLRLPRPPASQLRRPANAPLSLAPWPAHVSCARSAVSASSCCSLRMARCMR